MSIEVPKKFYRNVVRGVSYYSQEKKRACKLDELVAYVYLKNSRALPAHRIKPIVEKAISELCQTGLIRKQRNNYRLSEQLTGSLPEDESPVLEALAGPSGTGRNTKRKASPRGKRSASKSNKQSRAHTRPAVDATDGAPEPKVDDSQAEESEEENEYDSEEEEEKVLQHRPLKVEKEDSTEDLEVQQVLTPEAAPTSEPDNETEKGSSPAEGSSA